MFNPLQGDLYRGTTTASGRGSDVGVLGAGVYLTWDRKVAKSFARLAADKRGGEPVVRAYQLVPDLRFMHRDSPEWEDVMASFGFQPWDNVADHSFSAMLAHSIRDAGYDGVISSDPYDGLVIFDSQNVVGYVDPNACSCGKRKLLCQRCGHYWCAFGCEKQYEDCPECSICKECGEDELEECYECKNLWCTDCEGYDCPGGCE